MSKEKLKPCPFCGGQLDIETLTDSIEFKKYRGICYRCGITTKWYSLKKNLIKAINRRAK